MQQQRQLRLGDILDDYCPRERRVTNHAVVAMIDADVKQTRCTTCDAEHEYKHAKVPRQRRKAETPAALYAQVAASGPKRIAHEPGGGEAHSDEEMPAEIVAPDAAVLSVPEELVAENGAGNGAGTGPAPHSEVDAPLHAAPDDEDDEEDRGPEEDGPVHRPLIRASLPRSEGQQPPARPIPEFTIRQPGGRPNRFRPRGPRPGQIFQGNRSNGGNGNVAGGPPRGMRSGPGGRPPQGIAPSRMSRRHGPPGRKRSK
jgi:hypothetical protein